MPYVQSERSILYSLHRSACSRGLQAGRERELVPDLCVERCGLLETLLSGSGEACVWIYVSLCECSSIFFPCLEATSASPFIVEGGTGAIHVFTMQCLVSGGGVSESCSLLLWWHGQRSGLVLDALERRAGHTRSCATWEPQ